MLFRSNKGLALPFISYGGSNLVIMMGCIGLLINIGRHATCNFTSRSGVMDMDEMAAPENA